MPLILGVTKGDQYYVNKVLLNIVETAEDRRHIHINLDGKEFLLNDREFVEIYPEVFACVGRSRFDTTLKGEEVVTRLAIDAPRSIRIKKKRIYTYGSRNYSS